MKKTELYVCSMVNSIKAVDGYGAYLLAFKNSQGKDITVGEICELKGATKLTSELMLVAQALSKYKEPCEITVHVNVAQTITALSEWMPAWKESGWRNSRGDEVSPWYQTISEEADSHIMTFTAEKGEFTSWLESEARRQKEGKKSLVSLEKLRERRKKYDTGDRDHEAAQASEKCAAGI